MQFYSIGGSRGGVGQSVSGLTTICLMQCNTSPSHRVDQVVDCGLCNVGPLLFNVCVKLLDIVRNWNMLSYTLIQSNPTHAQWVACPVSMLAMQELGCFQLPGTVYRSLAAWCRVLSCCNMRWWSWMNCTTMGLRISSQYRCAFKCYQ